MDTQESLLTFSEADFNGFLVRAECSVHIEAIIVWEFQMGIKDNGMEDHWNYTFPSTMST